MLPATQLAQCFWGHARASYGIRGVTLNAISITRVRIVVLPEDAWREFQDDVSERLKQSPVKQQGKAIRQPRFCEFSRSWVAR